MLNSFPLDESICPRFSFDKTNVHLDTKTYAGRITEEAEKKNMTKLRKSDGPFAELRT